VAIMVDRRWLFRATESTGCGGDDWRIAAGSIQARMTLAKSRRCTRYGSDCHVARSSLLAMTVVEHYSEISKMSVVCVSANSG
jgi:hypothetical protein